MNRHRVKLSLLAVGAAGIAVLAYACHDAGKPAGPPVQETAINVVNPGLIKLFYECGNVFRVRNSNQEPAGVQYRVGTGALVPLDLPAPAVGAAFNDRYFTTATKGTVTLFYGSQQIGKVTNGSKSCAAPYLRGSWSALTPWPIVAVHTTLLPDGNVLSWSRGADTVPPVIWNPQNGTFISLPIGIDIFCAGHALLADGRLLVSGGHITQDHGLKSAVIFDYTTNTWSLANPMRDGRWYPSNTALPNGEMLTISGGQQDGNLNLIPEVYDASGNWRELTDVPVPLHYYPFMFVAPDGRVFQAGPDQTTGWLDPSGTGTWTPGPTSAFGLRAYGSAVMYEPGKIVMFGGGGPPTATVEVIDLNGSATWRTTAPMPTPRRQNTATILPDGKVLVTGGTRGAGFNNAVGAQKATLLWNPVTEGWTTLANIAVNRLYHSTALLLPDGRVLSAGSGQPPATGEPDQYNAQTFSPPYLFKPQGGAALRPVITGAPSSIGYGQQFQVDSPNASETVAVALIRLGSVTHSFDENQRFMRLASVVNTGFLTVTAPANANLAPPGHYLLFLVNANGVPSVGTIIQVL
jgi:hypothetical protein